MIFLGAFAKLAKTNIIFVLSVSLSVCFHGNVIFDYESVEKIQVSFNTDTNKGYFTYVRNVLDKGRVETLFCEKYFRKKSCRDFMFVRNVSALSRVETLYL